MYASHRSFVSSHLDTGNILLPLIVLRNKSNSSAELLYICLVSDGRLETHFLVCRAYDPCGIIAETTKGLSSNTFIKKQTANERRPR
jgi:hypothetical protein